MRKKFTFLLMTLLALAGFRSWGQENITVQIGTGAEITYNLPFNSYYGYSYNEMLIRASEINDAFQGTITSGTINSISFQAYWGNSGSTSFDFDIYMKNVDRTDYDDNGWETVLESDNVKSGTITSGVNDWVELTLDEPFQWDGTKNLLIVFDADNYGVYVKTYFYYDQPGFSCGHTVYSDSYNYEPSSSYPSGGYNTVVSYRPNIKLNMDVVTATTYAINLTPPDAAVGTISATPTSAIEGATVTLSANLNPGYELDSWTVTNATTSESIDVTNNQFTMPDSDVNVSVTYNALTQHNITVVQPSDQEEVGTFTADPTQAYKDERINLSYNLKQYDDHGYKFTSWTVTKTGDPTTIVAVDHDGQDYFTMPDYPVTVSAEYEQETYYALTIIAENGDVNAYPNQHITAGTMVSLNQYPDAGYDFGGWDVYYTENPDNKITVEYNQFEMPAAAVTVTATFTAKELYTVSIGTIENGTVSLIDAPAENKYYEGQQVKFNVTPDAGYMIDEVTYICDQTINIWYNSSGGYYYFDMPEAAVTINASFIMGITVYDGTETDYTIPVFGSYVSGSNYAYQKNQFIFPATDLEDLKDSKITDLTFYSSNTGSESFPSSTWSIFMKEVDYTTPNSFLDWNQMVEVYNGTIAISDNELTIHLGTPFEYSGGNLMIGFRENSYSNYDVYTIWYGVKDTDVMHSIVQDYNLTNVITNFLPKTTIIYEPVVTYNITLVQPEDEDEVGAIAADMAEAAQGKTVTLSFNPKQYDDHSYKVSSWNVTKTGDATVTVDVADNNTFVMPAYSVTVSADIETVAYYALTVDEEIEGGSVEAYPAEHIELGQQVELNASPAQHYKFVEWNITKVPSGDAFPVPALPNTTFNMPASALNVSATFEAYLPHTITLPDAVAEGYVTASQTEGLYCYDNVTLTVHPAEHCSLQSIDIMTGETPVSYTQDGNNYYFTMPDGDVTVTATFVENSKYNVSLDYNEDGGSITLQDGNTKYYAGDRVNLSVAANTGYILLSLEAEDSEHNPVAIANNQFTMPEDDVTVTAEFVHGITVNDGNNTNGYVPINGYNADAYTKSQFIIPESSLVDMKNGKIESMAFYLSDPSDSHTFTGNWKVYIKNVVNATTLSNYETLSAEEKVYEGGIAITNGKMTVNIPEDNQYEYRGGNLLIGFEQTQMGNWHTTTWLGVNKSSNTAYAGYTGQYGDEHHSAYQFLPKVTFLYEPGEPLPEYDITFHSNGIVSKQTLTEGQSLPNPTNIPAGLTFAGWAAADIATYTEVEPEYVTAARAEEDLYAVFSYSEIETTSKGAGTWTKVTDVNELANNDKVVLVYSNKILGQRGSDDYSFTALSNDLTIVGDAITNIPDNAIEFTLQQNGEYWNLNYYDAKLNETTSIATFEFYLTPASYGYGSNNWAAESNSGAVVFKTDGNTRYIGYNTNVMKVVSSSGNKCNVYKAGAPVVTKTYYMTEVLTNGNIAANTTAKNIIITTGTVTVDNNIVLTMNENGLFRNENAANFVFGYGAQLITDNAGVLATMKKHINGNEWYTISSPLAASVNVTDVTNLIPGNNIAAKTYDLYRLNEAEGIWENARPETDQEPAFTTIDKGCGYIYANNAGADHIAFAGEVNVAPAECTLTNGAAHGFNLIGNPFMQNIKLTDVKSDGTAVLADGFYVLNNDETWATEPITTGTIAPLQGFLVQATTAGTATISKPTAAPSKGERSEQNTNIEMIVSNSIYRDNAYAMFGEGTGLNKVSHRNAQAPMLYIPQGNEDFAIAFMDENTTIFPVSFKAMTTGSYSISLKPTDDVSTLVLVDNMTGAETNMLLEESYKFIGSPADNENRFTVKLKISNSQDGDEDEHFAYQNGSELVINGEGTLQIFDILGRVVVSEEVHGQTVNVGGLNTGAYIVRLTGESVKTQKIVVR